MFPIKNPYQAAWARDAVDQLVKQWHGNPPIPKTTELNASIVSYLKDRHMIDASNLYQGPEDVLQMAEVIEDDVSIRTHDGSDRRYDKYDPRVEIILTVIDE